MTYMQSCTVIGVLFLICAGQYKESMVAWGCFYFVGLLWLLFSGWQAIVELIK